MALKRRDNLIKMFNLQEFKCNEKFQVFQKDGVSRIISNNKHNSSKLTV